MDKIQLHAEVGQQQFKAWGIGFLTDDYRKVNEPYSCRTWVDDTIWAYKNDKKEWKTVIDWSLTDRMYSLDKFNLLMSLQNPAKSKENIKNRIASLHKLEDKYGMKRTEVFETNIDNYVVFHGDPIWHSEVWKSSLYTNYLKTLVTDDYYTNKRDKYEEVLWTMATQDNNEKLQPENGNIHGRSGFVSMIDNENLNSPLFKEMCAKILGATARISSITGLPVRKYTRKG